MEPHGDLSKIIKLSQGHMPVNTFKETSMQANGLAVLSLFLCISLLLVNKYFSIDNSSPKFGADFITHLTDKAPFFLSPGLLIAGACIYTNWRQSHEASIKLIDVINSNDFMLVRLNLTNIMQKADGINDIEVLDGWFPLERSSHFSKYEDLDHFKRDYALSNMAYLIYQVSVYQKSDLMNKNTSRQLFHFFFSHYHLVMLEFASALKRKRKELEKTYGLDVRWDVFAEGIEEFFDNVGLGGSLNPTYRYWFFPSMNKQNINHE